MENINDWCSANQMAINTDKTKAMLATTYQRYYKDLNIRLGGHTLEVVKSEKRVKFRQIKPYKCQNLNTVNPYFPTLIIIAVSGAMPNLIIDLTLTGLEGHILLSIPG